MDMTSVKESANFANLSGRPSCTWNCVIRISEEMSDATPWIPPMLSSPVIKPMGPKMSAVASASTSKFDRRLLTLTHNTGQNSSCPNCSTSFLPVPQSFAPRSCFAIFAMGAGHTGGGRTKEPSFISHSSEHPVGASTIAMHPLSPVNICHSCTSEACKLLHGHFSPSSVHAKVHNSDLLHLISSWPRPAFKSTVSVAFPLSSQDTSTSLISVDFVFKVVTSHTPNCSITVMSRLNTSTSSWSMFSGEQATSRHPSWPSPFRSKAAENSSQVILSSSSASTPSTNCFSVLLSNGVPSTVKSFAPGTCVKPSVNSSCERVLSPSVSITLKSAASVAA
mmetsp:Transcript_66384/g.175774  ORF Transcript_66384/g.175774 Transcript_66384/m.175774 type:complete len:336 (+) Transcript_66384:1105-2112(+)